MANIVRKGNTGKASSKGQVSKKTKQNLASSTAKTAAATSSKGSLTWDDVREYLVQEVGELEAGAIEILVSRRSLAGIETSGISDEDPAVEGAFKEVGDLTFEEAKAVAEEVGAKLRKTDTTVEAVIAALEAEDEDAVTAAIEKLEITYGDDDGDNLFPDGEGEDAPEFAIDLDLLTKSQLADVVAEWTKWKKDDGVNNAGMVKYIQDEYGVKVPAADAFDIGTRADTLFGILTGDEIDLESLENGAEALGVELAYGRTKKEADKKALAAVALVAYAIGEFVAK